MKAAKAEKLKKEAPLFADEFTVECCHFAMDCFLSPRKPSVDLKVCHCINHLTSEDHTSHGNEIVAEEVVKIELDCFSFVMRVDLLRVSALRFAAR